MDTMEFCDPRDVERWKSELRTKKTIPLWEEGAPGFRPEFAQPQPSMVWCPANGKDGGGRGTVLLCAGGSYTHKENHESWVIAERLNTYGMNAVVLDYRVVPYKRDVIELDVLRAMRLIRAHAREWNIPANKVAVMGFSAGGNLAVLAGLHGDNGRPGDKDPIERFPSRADACVLCYACAGFVEELTEPDDDDEIDLVTMFEVLKSDLTDQFPPTFLWQSMEDELIRYEYIGGQLLADLHEAGVPVEAHYYPFGPHGQGLGEAGDGANALTARWMNSCKEWLEYYGF